MNTEAINIDLLIPIVSGTLLFGLLIVFVVYFVILSRRNQIRFEFEKEKLKNEILTVEIEMKEEILSGISRELHDNHGHLAALINLNLDALNQEGLPTEEVLKLKEIEKLSQQLIQDIKLLSRNLSGDIIKEEGWVNMIQTNVNRINNLGLTKFNFNCDSAADFISSETQLILFRLIQEMITNTLKYAKASTIDLAISLEKDSFQLIFSDNGIGFNTNKAGFKYGAGLKNIKKRCEIINASYSLESSPANGTIHQIILSNEF